MAYHGVNLCAGGNCLNPNGTSPFMALFNQRRAPPALPTVKHESKQGDANQGKGPNVKRENVNQWKGANVKRENAKSGTVGETLANIDRDKVLFFKNVLRKWTGDIPFKGEDINDAVYELARVDISVSNNGLLTKPDIADYVSGMTLVQYMCVVFPFYMYQQVDKNENTNTVRTEAFEQAYKVGAAAMAVDDATMRATVVNDAIGSVIASHMDDSPQYPVSALSISLMMEKKNK